MTDENYTNPDEFTGGTTITIPYTGKSKAITVNIHYPSNDQYSDAYATATVNINSLNVYYVAAEISMNTDEWNWGDSQPITDIRTLTDSTDYSYPVMGFYSTELCMWTPDSDMSSLVGSLNNNCSLSVTLAQDATIWGGTEADRIGLYDYENSVWFAWFQYNPSTLLYDLYDNYGTVVFSKDIMNGDTLSNNPDSYGTELLFRVVDGVLSYVDIDGDTGEEIDYTIADLRIKRPNTLWLALQSSENTVWFITGIMVDYTPLTVDNMTDDHWNY